MCHFFAVRLKMNKIYTVLIIVLLTSCTVYDDTALVSKLDSLQTANATLRADLDFYADVIQVDMAAEIEALRSLQRTAAQERLALSARIDSIQTVPGVWVTWDANPAYEAVDRYWIYVDGRRLFSTTDTVAQLYRMVEVSAENEAGESGKSEVLKIK